jgi:hypothetical protein
MKGKRSLFAVLAWMQLVFSVLLAASIVWVFVNYQGTIGQVVNSVAVTVDALSTAVLRTVETVEAQKGVIDEVDKSLKSSRGLVTAARDMVRNQEKELPVYADATKTIATSVTGTADRVQLVGERWISLKVPTPQLDKGVPTIRDWRPFEDEGNQLVRLSVEIRKIGSAVRAVSDSLLVDASRTGKQFVLASDQLIAVIDGAEGAISRVKQVDLPLAVNDLKVTSERLKAVKSQVDSGAHVALGIMIVGLLLSAWCIVHSLGVVMLARGALN